MIRLKRVDLPTFGEPTIATIPTFDLMILTIESIDSSIVNKEVSISIASFALQRGANSL